MLAGLVAEAVGVAPRRLNYVAFSGGGESLSAIVGGQVSVGVNGLAEFAPHLEAGTLRALGISSASRLPGLDVPTLLEQGVNVEFENWRSIVAPPGISRSDRRRLEGLVERMTRTAEWQEALARYRWLDRYLAGPALDRFVATRRAREPGSVCSRKTAILSLIADALSELERSARPLIDAQDRDRPRGPERSRRRPRRGREGPARAGSAPSAARESEVRLRDRALTWRSHFTTISVKETRQ